MFRCRVCGQFIPSHKGIHAHGRSHEGGGAAFDAYESDMMLRTRAVDSETSVSPFPPADDSTPALHPVQAKDIVRCAISKCTLCGLEMPKEEEGRHATRLHPGINVLFSIIIKLPVAQIKTPIADINVLQLSTPTGTQEVKRQFTPTPGKTACQSSTPAGKTQVERQLTPTTDKTTRQLSTPAGHVHQVKRPSMPTTNETTRQLSTPAGPTQEVKRPSMPTTDETKRQSSTAASQTQEVDRLQQLLEYRKSDDHQHRQLTKPPQSETSSKEVQNVSYAGCSFIDKAALRYQESQSLAASSTTDKIGPKESEAQARILEAGERRVEAGERGVEAEERGVEDYERQAEAEREQVEAKKRGVEEKERPTEAERG